MLNAASLLQHAARSHAERTAIVFEDQRLSYAALARAANRAANGLAIVVGVADAHYVEEVKAYIVPVEGACVSAEAIVAWARENTAAYKYPRLVEIRDALPPTATGKILKRELR